jgi:hypothetical protein
MTAANMAALADRLDAFSYGLFSATERALLLKEAARLRAAVARSLQDRSDKS